MSFRRSLVPLAALGMVCAIPTQAQRSLPEARPRPAVTFMAGPSAYDLSGTGTAAFGAVRFDVPVGRVFILEPGVAIFRYTAQSADAITYLFPEVSFQAQVPGGGVRPYLGGGIGFTEFLSGRAILRGLDASVSPFLPGMIWVGGQMTAFFFIRKKCPQPWS
jgi:hypothetical protein